MTNRSALRNTARTPSFALAFIPQLASLTTYQNCVRLADLNGDGDERFLVADLDRRLKVYKGMAVPCALLNA